MAYQQTQAWAEKQQCYHTHKGLEPEPGYNPADRGPCWDKKMRAKMRLMGQVKPGSTAEQSPRLLRTGNDLVEPVDEKDKEMCPSGFGLVVASKATCNKMLKDQKQLAQEAWDRQRNATSKKILSEKASASSKSTLDRKDVDGDHKPHDARDRLMFAKYLATLPAELRFKPPDRRDFRGRRLPIMDWATETRWAMGVMEWEERGYGDVDGPNKEEDDNGPRLIQYTPTATYDRDKKQTFVHAPHYRCEIQIPDPDARGPPKIRHLGPICT